MTIAGIHHFALAVPDLAEADTFYTDFGLDTTETELGLGARSPGRNHDELEFVEGPDKRLHHIGFRADEDGLEQLTASLHNDGISVTVEPPAGGVSEGVWFQDPHDLWINVRVTEPEPVAEFTSEPHNFAGRADRVDIAGWTSYDPTPRPRQLGHFLVYTPDLATSEDWYRRHLGFIISDRSVGKATFMRVTDGFHHIFGFVGTSDHNGFHHASFEMAGADEIVLGTQQMNDKGHHETWGLGRHTIGSNLFSYIRDPWGSWCEYFTDMDIVTSDWQPSDVQAPPHLWSPPVEPGFFPHKFFHNFEPA